MCQWDVLLIMTLVRKQHTICVILVVATVHNVYVITLQKSRKTGFWLTVTNCLF